MEAKDTVMNDVTKIQFRFIPRKPSKDISRWDIEGMLLAQTEITWKARDLEIEEAKKAGAKEILVWGEEACIAHRGYATRKRMCLDCWQEKLKECGL